MISENNLFGASRWPLEISESKKRTTNAFLKFEADSSSLKNLKTMETDFPSTKRQPVAKLNDGLLATPGIDFHRLNYHFI